MFKVLSYMCLKTLVGLYYYILYIMTTHWALSESFVFCAHNICANGITKQVKTTRYCLADDAILCKSSSLGNNDAMLTVCIVIDKKIY